MVLLLKQHALTLKKPEDIYLCSGKTNHDHRDKSQRDHDDVARHRIALTCPLKVDKEKGAKHCTLPLLNIGCYVKRSRASPPRPGFEQQWFENDIFKELRVRFVIFLRGPQMGGQIRRG